MEFPNDLKYCEEHTWVRIKEDYALVGITEYASKELGEILFVDLPQEDELIGQGESFGTLESSKTISDLFAPVSGRVIEVNSDLENDPGIINEYPYDDGWLLKIELTDESELEELLDDDTYRIFVEEVHDEDVEDDFEDEDDDDLDFDDEEEDDLDFDEEDDDDDDFDEE